MPKVKIEIYAAPYGDTYLPPASPQNPRIGDTKMKTSISNQELIEEIVERVSAYDIRSQRYYPEPTVHSQQSRRAAVLLPITVKDGEVLILLTKRSKDLRTHPSTVAFPGGMRDEIDETDIDAALREAEEEIGLPPSLVRVLGILTLGITLPQNIVYPVVGIIPEDFLPNCNPSEVEHAFYMPLKLFIEKEKVLQIPITVQGLKLTAPVLHYVHNHVTEKIHGFTCKYCIFLAAIIFRSDGKKKHWTLAEEMQEELQNYLQFIISRTVSKL